MFLFGKKQTGSTPDPDPGPLPEGTRRVHVVFEGRVQGVGFRWNARAIALELGLTGWVRNEDDFNTVTMELQGPSDKIGEFFTGIVMAYKRYPIHYHIAEKEDIEPIAGEKGFGVRY